MILKITTEIMNPEMFEELLYSKAGLIEKMLKTQKIQWSADDWTGRYNVWWDTEADPENADIYKFFIITLCRYTAKRKNHRVILSDLDKAYQQMRYFLIRLGYVGEQDKKARAVLLEPLK